MTKQHGKNLSGPGELPAPAQLPNLQILVSDYYRKTPKVTESDSHKVSFGTSGHRGSSLSVTFNEWHILAITQAIVDYRKEQGVTGPIYVGKDTHALSEPAFSSVLEVLAGNGQTAKICSRDSFTPTPVVSHAILTYNAARTNESDPLADGIIITPSHNPPQDGGIKYNPPHGGPADTDATSAIAEKANAYLANQLEGVKRVESDRARELAGSDFDYIEHYVSQLKDMIDFDAIRKANIKIGVDPMGGSGIDYWEPIAERYGIDIQLVNRNLDATFRFMPLDKDSKIRMDCSSPWAMSGLVDLQDEYDIAIGNDPDYDRHGIVCSGFGLMNPNAYLAVAIDYLSKHRPNWGTEVGIGKTLVSSAIIDKVVKDNNRQLLEMPVGFKWYVDGLYSGALAFGGEESAGASFVRKDGSVWTTDKDGIVMGLLAAEIKAVTGKSPAEYYEELTAKHGKPFYKRLDSAANPEQKAALLAIDVEAIACAELAGDPVVAILSEAPGNGKAIGGIKVQTENGWFAARPSGTENIYKIYMESLVSEAHLSQIEAEASALVESIFASASQGADERAAS